MCSSSVRNFGGKSGSTQLVLHHADAHHDVAQQLPLGCVAEAALVTQFVDLADVVQDRAGQQQVGIDVLVVRPRELGQLRRATIRARSGRPDRRGGPLGGRRAR